MQANLLTRGLGPCCDTKLIQRPHYGFKGDKSLTVTDAMSFAIAVVALDGTDDLGLFRVHRAELLFMTELVAVTALGQAAVDNLTGVLEAFHVLFGGFGPELALPGASRLGVEAVGDSIFLVQIALEVHVGQGLGKVGVFDGDEPEVQVLGAKGLLKFGVRSLRDAFGVSLDTDLDVVDILFFDGLDDGFPGSLSSQIVVLATIDLASRLASSKLMA